VVNCFEGALSLIFQPEEVHFHYSIKVPFDAQIQ